MGELFLEHVLATYPIERVGEFHVATQFVLSIERVALSPPLFPPPGGMVPSEMHVSSSVRIPMGLSGVMSSLLASAF